MLDDDDGAGGEGNGYAWEAEYERTWEALPVAPGDEPTTAAAATTTVAARRLRRRAAAVTAAGDSTVVRRGLQRALVLVVDMGRAMGERDMRPTRLAAALAAAEDFVREFFDQSPTSQLGVAVTRNSEAAMVASLGASPARHIDALREAAARGATGDMSVQNALLVCADALRGAPRHACKEALLLCAGLTTCDPGSVFATLATLRGAGVRASVVSLTAELRLFQRIAEETGGTSRVALSEHHLRDLLLEHTKPVPSAADDGSARQSQLIRMGFPSRVVHEEYATFCACHQELRHGGYLCPQCGAKSCELPATCPVCGLSLLSSAHLARSYHHLFPVPSFTEVETTSNGGGSGGGGECAGCALALSGSCFRCSRCRQIFCDDCEAFIHETLHNCPSCQLLLPLPSSQ
jgi:transcription initiation factor TFIIH subunit 2